MTERVKQNKVLIIGGSRMVSLTQFLPSTWGGKTVQIDMVDSGDYQVTIKITLVER